MKTLLPVIFLGLIPYSFQPILDIPTSSQHLASSSKLQGGLTVEGTGSLQEVQHILEDCNQKGLIPAEASQFNKLFRRYQQLSALEGRSVPKRSPTKIRRLTIELLKDAQTLQSQIHLRLLKNINQERIVRKVESVQGRLTALQGKYGSHRKAQALIRQFNTQLKEITQSLDQARGTKNKAKSVLFYLHADNAINELNSALSSFEEKVQELKLPRIFHIIKQSKIVQSLRIPFKPVENHVRRVIRAVLRYFGKPQPPQGWIRILGIEEAEITPETVKSAYRESALKYHSDKLPATLTPDERAEAENRFIQTHDAYEGLMRYLKEPIPWDQYQLMYAVATTELMVGYGLQGLGTLKNGLDLLFKRGEEDHWAKTLLRKGLAVRQLIRARQYFRYVLPPAKAFFKSLVRYMKEDRLISDDFQREYFTTRRPEQPFGLLEAPKQEIPITEDAISLQMAL